MPEYSIEDETSRAASRLDRDLSITSERREILAPKLEALLTELSKIRELETLDSEPATPFTWGHEDANHGV